MDPLTLGVLFAVGAGGAAALARWRLWRAPKPRPTRPAPEERATLRTGDVLTYLGDEYWLAGELSLAREGTVALQLFSAPERGAERWVALAPTGTTLHVLRVNEELEALGWPGVEVPLGGMVLRMVERGSCAVSPSGEVPPGWEGLGRYALFTSMENVALVLEQGPRRLALFGKSIPRRLVEKLG